MAKVKIFLSPGETQQDVEEVLFKALNHHNSGDVHQENFEDPAMTDLVHKLESTHKKIYSEMLQEISETLDEDYLKLYGN